MWQDSGDLHAGEAERSCWPGENIWRYHALCRRFFSQSAPERAEWLDDDAAEKLILAEPAMNISPDRAAQFVTRIIEGFDHLKVHLEKEAYRRGEELLNAHRRVRSAARMSGVKYRVEPHLPPDVLGIYVYLPVTQP